MRTFIRKLFALPVLLGLLALAVPPAHAQDQPSTQEPASSATVQNPEQALANLNKQVDGIKTTLSGKAVNTPLRELRDQANEVQHEAAELVDALTPQMDSVQARLTVLGPPPAHGAPPETATVRAQRRELERSASKLDSEIKQAQLVSEDASKLTTQIVEARNQQFQTQLSSRTHSPLSAGFWSDLAASFPEDSARVQRVKGLLLDGLGSAWQPSNRLPLIWCLLGAVLLIVPGRWLAERAMLAVASRYLPDGHLRRSALAVIFTLTITLSIGLAARLGYLGLNWNDTLGEDMETLAQSIVRSVFFSAFIAGLGRALLSARHPSWRLPTLTDATARRLRWFPWLLGGAFLLLSVLEHFNAIAGGSLPATVSSRALLALLITGLVGLALARLLRARRALLHATHETARHPLWMGILLGLAGLGVALAWLSVLVGYVALAFFISWQMLWIGMIVASLYILSHLQHDLFDLLLSPHGRCGHRLQATFGLASTTLDQASAVLSAACRVVLLLAAIGTLLMPFGGGPQDLFAHIGNVFTGLKVGQLTIKPGAVFNALIVFVIGLLAVRVIKRWLSEQLLPKTTLDTGMQNSIVTLLGYVAVVIVFALSLKTADVSLESITWIASALSVGIGFGLQAIVQNFISGLILLAEQPVKVGDWVSMPGVEGDIRRINVRATEIQLSDRSTMIVPNSQFITQNLRNVTHGNALGRVKVSLPMPLDTDAAKVRELMLEALQEHASTLAAPAPVVRLEDITSSAMTFAGVAYVRSPRDASAIKSDLLFDILERFNKARLPLSSPQNMVVRNLGPLGEDSPAAPSL